MAQPLIDGKPINFDGWVMVGEYSEGVLLNHDISLYTGEPVQCEIDVCNARSGRGMPFYSVDSYEDSTVLCQRHVEKLWANRKAGGYVMGAVPTN